jgi:hypothetical protein
MICKEIEKNMPGLHLALTPGRRVGMRLKKNLPIKNFHHIFAPQMKINNTYNSWWHAIS